jgi:hypothetical protein
VVFSYRLFSSPLRIGDAGVKTISILKLAAWGIAESLRRTGAGG